MPKKFKIIIRKYSPTDQKAVEKIHFDTGFLGKSMDVFLSQHRFWNAGIKYYLEKEPESTFVADYNGKVVGYILGCLDDKNHNEFLEVIINTTFSILQVPLMPKRDRKFWLSQLRVWKDNITGRSQETKFRVPKNSGHLHINIQKKYRKQGIGTRLLNTFLDYAKENNVKQIHADSFKTPHNPNQTFWLSNGFKEFSKVKTTFWADKYPNEEIYLVCYVKNL